MKKAFVCILVIVVGFAMVSCQTTEKEFVQIPVVESVENTPEVMAEVPQEGIHEDDAPFVVGEDYTEYAMEGVSSWAPTYEAYLRIAAGEDELFNGKVRMTSDGMWVGEFVYAAGLENGFSTDGALDGFIYTIGEYVGGANNCYWTYTINGKSVNWACNEVHVLEGDYIEWTFAEMAW